MTGGKRRHADEFRIQAQQDVVHGGVAAQGDVFNVSTGKPQVGLALFRHFHFFLDGLAVFLAFFLLFWRVGAGNALVHQILNTLDDVGAHALQAVFVHHVKGDAGHDVFAVFALGVHHGGGVNDLSGDQVAKVGGAGGGAHVDGDAVGIFHLARTEAEDFPVHPDAHGHGPVAVPQGPGQFTQGVDVHGQVLQAEFSFQGAADALEIAQGFMERGGIHFHVVNPYRRIPKDADVPGGLADHLFAGTGLFRHEHQQIAFDLGHASQAQSLFLLGRGDEFILFLLPSGGVRHAGLDAVFFVEPFFDAHQALAADFFLAAGRFDVDAQLTGSLDQVDALGHLAPASGGLEDNFCCVL